MPAKTEKPQPTPEFRIAPMSMTGHSLVQWYCPDNGQLRSIQVETDIARLIVSAVNHHQELVEVLRSVVAQDGVMTSESFAHARAVLAQVEPPAKDLA